MVTGSVICLLLANDMSPLVQMAFASIRRVTTAQVVVGIVDESQKQLFPDDPKLVFMDFREILSPEELSFLDFREGYHPYTEPKFFSVVQLKWSLIEYALKSFPGYNVIFSDFDVLWLSNPVPALEVFFDTHENCEIAIQGNSTELNRFEVCMGFVCFRNSATTLSLVQELKEKHKLESMVAPVGDDAIMTNFIRAHLSCETFYVLPLHLFPTGNLSKLLSRRELFPGTRPPKQYIFHANYVVGLRKKALLMDLARRQLGVFSNETTVLQRLGFRLELLLRRSKYFFNSSSR